MLLLFFFYWLFLIFFWSFISDLLISSFYFSFLVDAPHVVDFHGACFSCFACFRCFVFILGLCQAVVVLRENFVSSSANNDSSSADNSMWNSRWTCFVLPWHIYVGVSSRDYTRVLTAASSFPCFSLLSQQTKGLPFVCLVPKTTGRILIISRSCLELDLHISHDDFWFL